MFLFRFSCNLLILTLFLLYYVQKALFIDLFIAFRLFSEKVYWKQILHNTISLINSWIEYFCVLLWIWTQKIFWLTFRFKYFPLGS